MDGVDERQIKQKIVSYGERKGQKGSVCVIGGSFEYSGAPYFAATAALRTEIFRCSQGSDLAFVVCDREAANVIKSYSPELIVFGIMDRNNASLVDLKLPETITSRLSALIVGPGLSRDKTLQAQALQLVNSAASLNCPILFDGDGIFLYSQKRSDMLLKSVTILTPNANELKLLHQSIPELGSENRNELLIMKGSVDRIKAGNFELEVTVKGAPRRCGGIGDVLSGVVGALLSMHGECATATPDFLAYIGFLACHVVRIASGIAFFEEERAMSAIDVIKNLKTGFRNVFE